MTQWKVGDQFGRAIYRDGAFVALAETPAIAAELADAANRRERKPSRRASREAVQSLLFAMHIYAGNRVNSRGPSGCIMSAIEKLDPATARRILDGAEPGDLLDDDGDPRTPEFGVGDIKKDQRT